MCRKATLILFLVFCLSSCSPPASVETPQPVPQRIVSLIPSATELIYEVGAGSLLVGVTLNDTYPAEVRSLPKVGDQTIDIEKLVTLRPDLVILDSEFNSNGSELERLGLPTLELSSKRLSDIAKNLRILGGRLGHLEQGELAAQRFERALSTLPTMTTEKRVFVEIWGSPLMTVGSESLPDDLLAHIGLKNAYDDQTGYFQVNPEDVVIRQPEVVILPSANPDDLSQAGVLLHKAGHRVKVVVLDGDLFTNPTPRVIEGLKILVRELEDSSR